MFKSKYEFEGMYFSTISQKVEGTTATQLVIVATMKGADIPMAKFVSTKDMYSKDLEKNHKALVDMNNLSDSIVHLLDSLVSCRKLGEGTYLKSMMAYSPFIETYLDYSKFLQKVQTVASEEGWV